MPPEISRCRKVRLDGCFKKRWTSHFRTVALVIAFFLSPCAYAQRSVQATQCDGLIHGVLVGQDGQPKGAVGLVLMPLGVDLDYVLPSTTTNQTGEYRFEKVCPGKYTVFVEDEKLGYPDFYHQMFLELSGDTPAVKITSKQREAQLRVVMPPKPAYLQVHAINLETSEPIESVWVRIRLAGKPRRFWTEMTADSSTVLAIPPDVDIILTVKADGFHEWKETPTHLKLIRVPSQTRMVLNARLEPRR